MKADLARVIEVHTSLGTVTRELVDVAKKEAKGAAEMLCLTFPVAAVASGGGVASILHGWPAVGAGLVVIGVFFAVASRFFWREMKYNEAVVTAYVQRDAMRDIHGDGWLLPEPEKKNNRR